MSDNNQSRFLCRMDSLSFALRAAVKVAGKKQLAYVRLYRLDEHTLAISALGNNCSFRVKLKVDFVNWLDDRDEKVELSTHAAASLAGYEVQIPDDLAAEPLVSVTIGPERIRVQDESGLFQTSSGRDEHRLADPVLPAGDHEKIFIRAATAPGAPFWITPDAITSIAGVSKVLHRRIVQLSRSELTESVSRWYVIGDEWQMTVSPQEQTRGRDDEQKTEGPTFEDQDDNLVADAVIRDTTARLVSANPTGGLA